MELIEERQVIPIVGQDLLRVEHEGESVHLYSLLARHLAKTLGIDGTDLPEGRELNEVALRFLSGGRSIEEIYPVAKRLFNTLGPFEPPPALVQLAEIEAFQLFVTTTFDDCMARALERVRSGPRVQVISYSPNRVLDLPTESESLKTPTVFHLFGRISAVPEYVLTQEDLLEFVHELQSETRRPRVLFDDLSRKSLLILGSSISGWLARFFIRMAKKHRLRIGGSFDYVADARFRSDANLVLFLNHFSKGTKVFQDGGAIEFVQELHARWRARRGDARPGVAAPTRELAKHGEGFVFLSYAREDLDAAQSIKRALEDAGIDVYLDEERLSSGTRWKDALPRAIQKSSLFIPLISRNSLTAERRYFRKEWKEALGEADKAQHSDPFILPVAIDDTTPEQVDFPEFSEIQWERLSAETVGESFVNRVRDLYRKHQKSIVPV